MTDFYYYPEYYGLKTIGEIDWCDEPYQFDMTVVWHDGENLLWGSDSGCSCPSPFEDFSRADLETGTLYDLMQYLGQRANKYTQPQVVDLLSRVSQFLRENKSND